MATQRYKVYYDLISPEGVARSLDNLIANVGPTSSISPQGAVLLNRGMPVVKYSSSGITRIISYRRTASGFATATDQSFGVYFQSFPLARDEQDRLFTIDDATTPSTISLLRNVPSAGTPTYTVVAQIDLSPDPLSSADVLAILPRNIVYGGRYSAGTYSRLTQSPIIQDAGVLAYITIDSRRAGHFRGADFNGRDVGAIYSSVFTPPGNNYYLRLYRHNAVMGSGGRGWDIYSRTAGFTDTSRGPIGLSWDGRQWWAFHYCEYTDHSDE